MYTDLVTDKKGLSAELEEKKKEIIKELRNRGFRVTEQRKLIIEIILQNECSCCKEIYYEALEKDASIGIATVYRMVRTLEEMGAMNRRQIYQLSCSRKEAAETGARVLLEDENGSHREVVTGEWYELLKQDLNSKGYGAADDFIIVIKKACNHCDGRVENDRLCCGD